MNRHFDRLNAWHLELGILADSLDGLLYEIDGPDWVSATGHILKARLRELLDSCPFPASGEVADFEPVGVIGQGGEP